MNQYGNAAITEMIIDKLPEITRSAAEPFASIDKFMVIDGGGENGATNTVSRMTAGNVAAGRQIVQEILGIDLADIVRAETYDAKVNRNINVNGLDSKAVAAATAQVQEEVTDTLV